MLAFRAAEDGLPRRFDRTVYRVPTTRALQQALDTAGGHTATVERDPHGVTHVLAHAPARSDTAPAPERADAAGR